jgi:uncharacterized protein
MVQTSATESIALRWVILKIVQRCNLNCTYCYVYNRGDDSWRDRPPVVSNKVVLALARRIKEQCSIYSLSHFTIELHGGEPLLIGRKRMQALVDLFRRECDGIQLEITLQTNGLLLDESWLKFFRNNNMRIGISCDGPPKSADRRRVFHDGQGSAAELVRIIDELRAATPLFDELKPGLLCVVDPAISGAETIRWFVQHGFRTFDFLLPDGTYTNPPQGWTGAEPYKRFLLEAFNEWCQMGGAAPRIRLFELMMRALMGVRPSIDYLGGDLRRLCVVESDGSMGLSDLIRICGGQFARDSLNIFDHRLDAVSAHYKLEELQGPCDECKQCRHFEACRGGLLPHRFDGKSFANPSLYCGALYSLADAAFHKLRSELPNSLWKIREEGYA